MLYQSLGFEIDESKSEKEKNFPALTNTTDSKVESVEQIKNTDDQQIFFRRDKIKSNNNIKYNLLYNLIPIIPIGILINYYFKYYK